MKKIISLSAGLVLLGLNSFGDTMPAKPPAKISRPAWQQTTKNANNIVAVPINPAQSALLHRSATPDAAKLKQIRVEGLLAPNKPQKDFGGTLASIFRTESDNVADTSVRGAYVTIFPTGR